MIEYTDEQHDSLIRGHRKQLADAQATVEALQRERDQWKEAFERSCDDTAYLKAALDAEREKAAQQGRYAVDLFDEIQRMNKGWCGERAGFESDLVKAETERDKLQALVREAEDFIVAMPLRLHKDHSVDWKEGYNHALYDVGQVLAGKRTLDATTPAQTDEQRFIEACCERPHDCKWGGTGGCGYEGRKPKGGDGE